MNHCEIITDRITPNVSNIILDLSPETEKLFQEKVFPWLFDGRTTGVRTKLPNGHTRHNLLVYDLTLVKTFKQILVNAMLIDNGQMN